MLIVKENVEQELLQTLDQMQVAQPHHRCLHMKLSQIEGNVKDWVIHIIQALRSYLDDSSTQIYACTDNDIVVITRSLTHKKLTALLSHIASKLSPKLASPEHAALYEVGVDWPHLQSVCTEKMGAIAQTIAVKPDKKGNNFEPSTRKEMMASIDIELLKSIATRRSQRLDPEVMVAEDDLFSQKLVNTALRNLYSVSMIADGMGAIMQYVIKAPDVLFLDIGLPDMSGHDVLKKIFEFDPEAYVIMFSGNGDRENVMRAINLGAKGFVGKPFTHEKLVQYIDKSPFIHKKNEKGAIDLARF